MKNNIFINKYVMACAISIVIALVGYISMSTLPVEQYPDIAPPTVQVSTSYTGADENTVMKSVIQPLEENINGVNDMTYMTSKASSNGDVEINVYFKQGSDPDMATVNVQNRVTRAQSLLPAEVNKVGVKVEKRQNNILQIFAVRSADGKYDEDFVSNYVDINITPRLMRINGVGNVQGLGNTYALRIWLKPDVMAQYGLTPNDVFNAIGGQSFVSAVGTLGYAEDCRGVQRHRAAHQWWRHTAPRRRGRSADWCHELQLHLEYPGPPWCALPGIRCTRCQRHPGECEHQENI